MDTIKKAVGALDLSNMDNQIMQYCKKLSGPLRLSRLDFVHVIPEEYIQTGRAYGMPDGSSLLSMVDSRIKDNIQKKINQYLPSVNLDIKISILEGNPVKALLDYIAEHSIDLLIAGRKEDSQGSGITAKKIARKAKCNFLFVPETPFTLPKRVLVPVDYSENSAEAVFAALTLKASIPEIEIITAHVMRLLPADYHYGLDNNPEFIQAHMEKNKKGFNYFLEEYEIPKGDVTPVFLEDHTNSISRCLLAYLHKEKFDMVIMGAQGHTALNSLLYGSVTERFVHYCADTTLMVVR